MILQNKDDFMAVIMEVMLLISEGTLGDGTVIEYPMDFVSISINDDKTVDIYRRAEKKVDGYGYTEAE